MLWLLLLMACLKPVKPNLMKPIGQNIEYPMTDGIVSILGEVIGYEPALMRIEMFTPNGFAVIYNFETRVKTNVDYKGLMLLIARHERTPLDERWMTVGKQICLQMSSLYIDFIDRKGVLDVDATAFTFCTSPS